MSETSVKSWLLSRIKEYDILIRRLEDDASKFSVDLSSNCAYTAYIGYRSGLKDVLAEIVEERIQNDPIRKAKSSADKYKF